MTDVVGGSVASDLIGEVIGLTDIYLFLGIAAETATAVEVALSTAAIKSAEGLVFSALGYNPVLAVQTEFYPRIDFAQAGQSVMEVTATSTYARRQVGEVTSELQVLRLPIREAGSTGADTIDLRVDYDGRSGAQSGSFATETLKVEGTDFWPNYDILDSAGRKVCGDGIIRSAGLWPSAAGSVKITYAAGYTASELAGTDSVLDASPIRDSIIDEAVRKFKKAAVRLKGVRGHSSGPLTSENLGDYSYSLDGGYLSAMMGYSASVLPETALRLEPFVNYGALYAL